MKQGSLVVCIKAFYSGGIKKGYLQKYVFPALNQVYTVREVITLNGETGIYLEETVNPKTSTEAGFKEACFFSGFFREVELPSNLSEVIAELLTEPFLVEVETLNKPKKW